MTEPNFEKDLEPILIKLFPNYPSFNEDRRVKIKRWAPLILLSLEKKLDQLLGDIVDSISSVVLPDHLKNIYLPGFLKTFLEHGGNRVFIIKFALP